MKLPHSVDMGVVEETLKREDIFQSGWKNVLFLIEGRKDVLLVDERCRCP